MRVFLALLALAATAWAQPGELRDGLVTYVGDTEKRTSAREACDDWLAWKKRSDPDSTVTVKSIKLAPNKLDYLCVLSDGAEQTVTGDVACAKGWHQDDVQLHKCRKQPGYNDKAGPTNWCEAKPQTRANRKATAKKLSDENTKVLVDDPFGKMMIKSYDAEKTCALAMKNDDDEKRPKIVKFGDEELCAGKDSAGVTIDVNDVNIGTLCGSWDRDFKAANAVAGYATTPKGCTWHHHEDIGRMQLVKTATHKGRHHAGGAAIWRRAFCAPDPSFRNSMCNGYRKLSVAARQEPMDVIDVDKYQSYCTAKRR